MGLTEQDVLFQVLDALDTLAISYMIVGSFASTYWGRPRTTQDADLLVEISPQRVNALSQHLAPHFYASDFVIEEAVRNRDQFNAIHLEYPFKVDFWLRKDTAYDRTRFDRRVLGTMFGRRVWVSSSEDVVLSKLQWYRLSSVSDRQLQDAAEVYEIQEPALDEDYLDHWASRLDVADLLADVRRRAAHAPEGSR
jgi:hypothetical protein